MEINFVPARDLNQQYDVLGHFYSLAVKGADPLKCRSALEIRSKGAALGQEADAVFVMMNPGSSEPASGEEDVVDVDGISGMKGRLVPTFPDTTQYQVMRVMHYAGWKHVRILNLSDLRDPKSGSFSERYSQFEKETGCTAHSVFSPERSAELKNHLIRKSHGRVVCAWGVADRLKPLIDRALRVLPVSAGITGVAKSSVAGRYYHPLPPSQHRQEQWVAQMLNQLLA